MRVTTHLSLAEYNQRASKNMEGLLAGGHPIIQLVEQYYKFFSQELWADGLHQPEIPMFLGLNSFLLWTAAVRVATSGHEAAVYPLLRTAIESACYSLVITRSPNLAPVWATRHDGEMQRKACRKAFGPAVTEASAAVSETSQTAAAFVVDLYESYIDLGAHPNTQSVMNHVYENSETEREVRFDLGSIYPGDSLQVFRALAALLDGGRGIGMVLVSCLPQLTDHVARAVQALENQHAALFPQHGV